MELKKANTLDEVVRYLNPKHSLTTEDKKFFLDRPNSPRERMINYLVQSEEQVKILFSGHRGSGKSTELNLLLDDPKIMKKYFIIKFRISDYVNMSVVDFVDVLIVLADRIREEIDKARVGINKDIIKQLDDWSETVTKRETIQKSIGIEGSLGFSSFIAKLLGQVRVGYDSDTEFKKEIKPTISNLWESLNNLLIDAELKLNKQILVAIDDLDKLDLDAAEQLFYKNAPNLVIPHCSIIFMFPIALGHSQHFRQISSTFDHSCFLPNLETLNKDEKPNPEVIGKVKDMVLKRMNKELFDSESLLEKLLESSGGILFEIIRLLQGAANCASTHGKSKIGEDEINKVLNELKADYVRLLKTKETLNCLSEIRKTKSIIGTTDEELVMRLLHELMVLEYPNDPIWHNVHPILFDRIPLNGA